ncbi:MAG: hypothetical protein ACYC56_15035 [Candidatus Aquicultor sp.]
MSEFKVGDRVRLEGVVVFDNRGNWTFVCTEGDADGNNGFSRYATERATLSEPVRPELKSGQVWEDASGIKVTLADAGPQTWDRDNFPFYGTAAGFPPNGRKYNSKGIRINEDATGPNYLVKLIEDVAEEVQPEPKAPPPLDTSKPMRAIGGLVVREFVDRTESGKVVVRDGEGYFRIFREEELENIPTPKRTMSRESVMVSVSGGEPYLTWDNCVPFGGKIIARGSVTLTEGDGL